MKTGASDGGIGRVDEMCWMSRDSLDVIGGHGDHTPLDVEAGSEEDILNCRHTVTPRRAGKSRV